jgi:hypothetical protein
MTIEVIVGMPSGGRKTGIVPKWVGGATHQFVQFEDRDNPIPVHASRIARVKQVK